MEAPAPIIEFAAYEKRLWSISTQLDPRERSLVLRFAQDLLMLGTELHSAPNCPTTENHRETQPHRPRSGNSRPDTQLGFDVDIGCDLESDEAPGGLRLFHQPH